MEDVIVVVVGVVVVAVVVVVVTGHQSVRFFQIMMWWSYNLRH